MGNCWSGMKEAMCGRCSEEETNLVSLAPERPMEPMTGEVVDADLQSKQNPMESSVASTSMTRTSTTPGAQKPPPTLAEVIGSFEALKDEADNIDELISHIRQVLIKKSKQEEKASTSSGSKPIFTINWSEWVKNGAKFLEFSSSYVEKTEKESGFKRTVVTAILHEVGQLHWAVAGLSIVAWLLENYEKMCANQAKCQQLLERMVDLAINVKEIYDLILKEEDENLKKNIHEKLEKAIVLIAEGSMKCCSQMNSTIKLFGFLNSSDTKERLNDLEKEISHSYNDLTLTATIINSKTIRTIEERQPVVLPMPKPSYPKDAVGLEEPVNQIMLELGKSEGAEAMVIYGFGGIGKTTLANAVVANQKLEDFNYTKVIIDEDPQKNDFKDMQQQLLKDVFPKYQHGRPITLRHSEEGRECLTHAFQSETNKPVFIFIDNALRVEDLEELLPEDLGSLPQRSRILVTARDLSVTDLFEKRSLSRRPYRVKTLSNEHALQILCNDPAKLEQIKDDVKEILQICGGIPLALKIVSAQLSKQKYRPDNCREILQALQKGEDIKQERLSERLVNFVYNRLETSAQEAFLDICSFFCIKNLPRRRIEYIVGTTEVATLEEAGLITTVPLANSLDDIRRKGVYWEDEEDLIVHDVIRAKGENMAKGTRIMDAESFSRAVKDQVLQSIKGVWFTYKDESTYMLEESQLSCTSNSLRVLRLGHRMSVKGRSSNAFQELRYLSIGGDIPCLPVKLEALPRLAYYAGPIFKEGFSINKLPKSLRFLQARAPSNWDECATSDESNSIQPVQNSSLRQLRLSALKNLPILLEGIHQFTKLEILWIHGWDKTEELPAQVCHLRSLNKLMMYGWKSLKRLPESFSNLTSLTHLDLRSCRQLEGLCSNFGELRGLRYLTLKECIMLTELPHSFDQLIALEYLNLCRCSKLTMLPDNFAQLTALKYLNLHSCKCLKELPLSLGELRSLEKLVLSYCNELKELPSNFVQLTNLRVLKLYGREELGAGLSQMGLKIVC